MCVMQLDPSIYESLQKERVEVGDVIYIEANSGAVKVRTTHNLLLFLLNAHWFRLLRNLISCAYVMDIQQQLLLTHTSRHYGKNIKIFCTSLCTSALLSLLLKMPENYMTQNKHCIGLLSLSISPYGPHVLFGSCKCSFCNFFCAVIDLQRQGRCDTFATEFDLEAEEYVPLPKGDVHKKKEIIQDVTLHDLDIANARPQVHTQSHNNIFFI